ncbi:UNVERIFIED_CONTAM: hypothetical protein NCL1_21094 [Trichonephila clavipes]
MNCEQRDGTDMKLKDGDYQFIVKINMVGTEDFNYWKGRVQIKGSAGELQLTFKDVMVTSLKIRKPGGPGISSIVVACWGADLGPSPAGLKAKI